MKKFNLGKLWFPKLINIVKNIHQYMIIEFILSREDEFISIKLLGINGLNNMNQEFGESSLFSFLISWNRNSILIELNLFFILHLKYIYEKYKNKFIFDIETDAKQLWNFKK